MSALERSPQTAVTPPPFEQCIKMLYSDDSMTYEDGYQWLQGYLGSHIDDIIAMMQGEEDADFRSRLVELVGNSRDPEAIPYLERELTSEHRQVRLWAYTSLLHFGSEPAEQVARAFGTQHPGEDFL
jgi:HEAT repeats